MYFPGCETTTFLSPVVVFPPTISSPVPPCSLVYPLHTLVIIFFLAMTHKSEKNCGFIYFHFLSAGEKRRGTSPVWGGSVISCFDGRDRWREREGGEVGKERKREGGREKIDEWRWNGGNNGARQRRGRRKNLTRSDTDIQLSEKGG